MFFYPAFLEFLGTTEMLVIAVVALIIFGPRKLPEIGRTIGKTLSEFKRTSEDFKRTWEREVEFERIEKDLRMPDINVDARDITAAASKTYSEPQTALNAGVEAGAESWAEGERTIARTPNQTTTLTTEDETETEADAPKEPTQKHDWL